MNKSKETHKLKQSIWFDNIGRNLIKNGWLGDQIEKEVIFGLTSNPSIFKKAITNSNDYSIDIQTMSWSGFDTKLIHEHLVLEDIRNVSDLLFPTYEVTAGVDGYVSLEVDPTYATNTELTIKEAKRLWDRVDRKNLMIKVPATDAGIPAIKELISSGINVNVTLIFSVKRYLEVIDAYFSGLEERIRKHLPINQIHSVASFFVSRLDVKIESKITDIVQSGGVTEAEVQPYLGTIGILNGLSAYTEFDNSRKSKRFQKISEEGGNIQRPLWASTGTKNADYSDVLYVEGLLLPHTVNTVPPHTLTAFLDHGKCNLVDYSEGKSRFELSVAKLESFGVNFEEVWNELETEGVAAFISAQNDLFKAIDEQNEIYTRSLSGLSGEVKERIAALKRKDFPKKFFTSDPELWTKEPSELDEILHRLGWIDAPITSREIIDEAGDLLKEIRTEGFTHALLLGMGGSSLAPEVFSEVFKNDVLSDENRLSLSILDSTDPIQIDKKRYEIPVNETLYIISSKSGTTAEVKALLVYFWKLVEATEDNSPGDHFIAITDPGTPLEKLGSEWKFRKIFHADPDVGGRYSALTAFGIVPAVLAGINVHQLLDAADYMRQKCSKSTIIEKNPGFILGTVLAEANFINRDKLTIIADPGYSTFGSWLEQLIAESSGKSGKGILPIDGEPIIPATQYSNDRLFYYLRKSGKMDRLVDTLVDQNHPVIVSTLNDTVDIAAEIYKWEIGIATACSLMRVNPFNQPNVQESKSITHEMISAFKQNPIIEDGNVIFSDNMFSVYGSMEFDKNVKTITEITNEFFKIREGDYLSINAFLPRIDEYIDDLQLIRAHLLKKYSVPVTLGFGPRFLHSTGQLHKGGKNNGLFLIITQNSPIDIEIPDEGMSFKILEKAQALGDMQALIQNNRRVLRIHLNQNTLVENDLLQLFDNLK